jgi:hypothetical protein
MSLDLLAAKAALERAGGGSSMGWIICHPQDEAIVGTNARQLGFQVQVRADCPPGQAFMTDRPF